MEDDEVISTTLRAAGIPCNLLGYKFLKFGVKNALEDPEILRSITKSFYPKIAKEFNTTSSRVERAIRHAIIVAWDRCDVQFQEKLLTVARKSYPTNSEFVATVVEHIKIDLM